MKKLLFVIIILAKSLYNYLAGHQYQRLGLEKYELSKYLYDNIYAYEIVIIYYFCNFLTF